MTLRFAPFVLAALLAPAAVFAAGDSTSFKVTVEKVYLKNSTGDWILAGEPKSTVDLAVEGPVFSMQNDGRVPPGEYLNAKVVLSETVRFSGTDGENKTKAGGKLRLGGTASKASDMGALSVSRFEQASPTWTKETEGEMEQTIDLDFEDRDAVMEIYGRRNLRKVLKVTPKSTIQVLLGIEIKRRINFAWPNFFTGIPSTEAMYWLPPKEVGELTLKIDASSAILTSEDVEWAF